MHTQPVIVLCQSHLLKVNVEPMAFGGLQDPVARQVVAVVARETRRDNSTIGSIFYHSPTGCYMRRQREEKKRKETKTSWMVGLYEKGNNTYGRRGVRSQPFCERGLHQYSVDYGRSTLGSQPGSKSVWRCAMDM